MGAAGSAGPPRTGPARRGGCAGRAVSALRPGADRHRRRRSAAVVAVVPTHPVRRAGPGRDGGPRDGRRAGRQPALAVHRGVLPGLRPGWAGWCAAGAAGERQSQHGPGDHFRGFRRRGGGWAGIAARGGAGGLADRPVAGLRHPGLSAHHAGAGVPGHGRGAGGATLWVAGQAAGRPCRERDTARAAARRADGAGQGGGRGGTWTVRRAATLPGRLCAGGVERTRHRRAIRRQPALHHGAGRHGELWPRRLFRRWRLCRRLAGQACRGPHGGGPAGGAFRSRAGRAAIRLFLRAALGGVFGHADPGLRADRLVHRLSVG